jgi:hypothetical protein
MNGRFLPRSDRQGSAQKADIVALAANLPRFDQAASLSISAT